MAGRSSEEGGSSIVVLSGVSGTGNFLMLDDVYDYTMIYQQQEGGGGGLLKVGWVCWSAGFKPRV